MPSSLLLFLKPRTITGTQRTLLVFMSVNRDVNYVLFHIIRNKRRLCVESYYIFFSLGSTLETFYTLLNFAPRTIGSHFCIKLQDFPTLLNLPSLKVFGRPSLSSLKLSERVIFLEMRNFLHGEKEKVFENVQRVHFQKL